MAVEQHSGIAFPGFPFAETPKQNARVQRILYSTLRRNRVPLDIWSTGLQHTELDAEAHTDQIRTNLQAHAAEHGPQVVVAVSADVPVVATAIRGLRTDVVAAFAGIASPINIGEEFPEGMEDHIKHGAPALWGFVPYYREHILPSLRENIHVPTLSIYGPQDDSVPPDMSKSWADAEHKIWTPKLPIDPRRGISHAAIVTRSLRSGVLDVFLRANLQQARAQHV